MRYKQPRDRPVYGMLLGGVSLLALGLVRRADGVGGVRALDAVGRGCVCSSDRDPACGRSVGS